MLHLKHSGSLVLAAALFTAPGNIANAQVFPSSAGNIAVPTFAKGSITHGRLAFLPDGRMLVTERPGPHAHRRKDGKLLTAAGRRAEGLSPGQGGLHDVMLDRAFAENRTIYFCYAEPAAGGGRTALARARLLDEGNPAPRRPRRSSSGRTVRSRAATISAAASRKRRTTISSSPLASISPRATKRRTSLTISARSFVSDRMARCRRTTRSSARPGPSRKSGASATAIRKGSRFIPPPASSGSTSTARAAVTRSTSSSKGKNYGWPVIGYGIDYNGARIDESTQKPGMEQPI